MSYTVKMQDPNPSDLIASGIALAEAGQTNAAILLWHQAARRGSLDGFFNIGLLYSKLAFATEDPALQNGYITSALTAFKPIAAPEFGFPKASLNIGILLDHVGYTLLNAPDLSQDNQFEGAHDAFTRAAHFFTQAANMPDYFDDGTPAQAMLKLADYARKGIGGFERDEALVAIWTERALKSDPRLKVGPNKPKRRSSKPKSNRDLN